jgi:hypothetical protein
VQIVLDAGLAVATIGGDGPQAPPGPADDPPNRGRELRCVGGVAALDGVVEHESGFALGWLVTEPFDASLGVAFVVALAAAVMAWVVATFVFRGRCSSSG